MSYVQDNLLPNEKILFSARIHPALFLQPVLVLIMSMALVIYAVSLATRGEEGASLLAVLFLFVAGIIVLTSIMLAIQAFIVMRTTEFAITNRRIVAKKGFIRRQTLEMLLPKVESVAVRQSVLGRLLNFGTVIVTGTGGTREGFSAIADPLTMRTKINQIIEYFSQARADQPKVARPGAGS